MAVKTEKLSQPDLDGVEFRQLGEGKWRSESSVSSNSFPDNIYSAASHAELELHEKPRRDDIIIQEYLENGDSNFEAVNGTGNTLMEIHVKENGAIDPEPLKAVLHEYDLERFEFKANTSYDWSKLEEQQLEELYLAGKDTEEILAGEIRDRDGEVIYKFNADKADGYSLQDLYTLHKEAGAAYVETMNTSLKALLLPSKMAANLTFSMLPEKEK